MSEGGLNRSLIIQRDRFLEIIRKPPDCQEAWNLPNRFGIVEYPEGDKFAMYGLDILARSVFT